MALEIPGPLEARMARLEGSYEQIDKRLAGVETQIADLRGDLRSVRTELRNELHSEITAVRGEIKAARDEQRQFSLWILGILILGVILPVALQFVDF